jgi:hypothetical protein
VEGKENKARKRKMTKFKKRKRERETPQIKQGYKN